jgi:hypothetical protein
VASIDTLLQQYGLTASDLSGSAVAGEIPVTNTVVNRFIAAQLAARNVPVSSVHLDAQADDSFVAHIVPKARFVPGIRLLVRVERQPELPRDPVIWLRWSIPGFGAFAAFAAPALALFRALPPGVRAEGERIGIDVREVLVSRGAGDLVTYLRALRVHTRPGAFLVRFDVTIADGAEPGGRTSAERAERPGEQR